MNRIGILPAIRSQTYRGYGLSYALASALCQQNALYFVQSPPTDIKRKRVKARFYAFRLLPPITISAKMPPSRTPLGAISGNRFKGCEISPYMRGKVAGQSIMGRSTRGIATDLKLTQSTIKYTLQQDELRNEGESLP
jgi:hypothetical protein